MTVSRRELFAASAVVTALASSGLSACSPPAYLSLDVPGRFFAAIAKGELVEARKSAHPTISLALANTVGTQTFDGPKDVTEALYRLLNVEGFSMIGDSPKAREAYGGMYWRELGPWQCSDMLKGDAIELGHCEDGLLDSVFNVFVNIEASSETIQTILLLENRNLIAQLGYWSDTRKFDK